MRFNHIQGNSGYAVLRDAGPGAGLLDIQANNMFGNRSGAQVECNTKGQAEHNYWGPGATAAAMPSGVTVAALQSRSSAGPTPLENRMRRLPSVW